MPRTIWKGAISFGLVTIPVKVFGATEEKDVAFRQVHGADGGRIKYKRVCSECGEEIPFAEIAKGFESADGRMAVLSSEDFEHLPLATAKTVEVVRFVETDAVDPVLFDRAYYLEAEGAGLKPYVLLRDALSKSGKSAVVKVAFRSRETLALLRVRDEVLVLQTMIWPDEVRDADFAAPTGEVKVSEAEVAMAQAFIEQLSGPFEVSDYTDSYREAVEALVNSKLEGLPLPEAAEGQAAAPVVDLVAALRASVEAAKERRAAEEAKAS